MIPWMFSQGGSKIWNKFFVSLNHTSRFRQGRKNYLHENWPCSRFSCYRKMSFSLMTVEVLGNKDWRPSPTPRSAALNLVFCWFPPRIWLILDWGILNVPTVTNSPWFLSCTRKPTIHHQWPRCLGIRFWCFYTRACPARLPELLLLHH